MWVVLFCFVFSIIGMFLHVLYLFVLCFRVSWKLEERDHCQSGSPNSEQTRAANIQALEGKTKMPHM